MTDSLRASDRERHAVSELLSRHFVDGRLDQEELDERIGAALRAKTRGDLASLLADLPRLDAAPPTRSPTPRRRTRRLAALALAVALPPFLMAASLLGHVRASRAVLWHDRPIPAWLAPAVRNGIVVPRSVPAVPTHSGPTPVGPFP